VLAYLLLIRTEACLFRTLFLESQSGCWVFRIMIMVHMTSLARDNLETLGNTSTEDPTKGAIKFRFEKKRWRD
jgi:hypothetical protein